MKSKTKIVLALILSLSLIFSQVMPVMAEEGDFADANASEEFMLEAVQTGDETADCDVENETEVTQEEVSEEVITEEIETPEAAIETEETAEEITEENNDAVTNASSEIEAVAEVITSDAKEAHVAIKSTREIAEGVKTVASKKMKAKTLYAPLPNGRYVPDAWSIRMASGRELRNPIDCTYVKVSGTTTYAQIVFHSTGYPKLTSNGAEYTSVVDEAAGTSTFFVPVEINKDYSIFAYSTKMRTTIEYVMNATVNASSAPYSGDTSMEIEEPEDDTIADGRYVADAWSIRMASGRELRNPIDCNYVKVAGDKTYAEIVYHSTGYPTLTSGGKSYTSVVDEAAGTSTFFIPVEINKDYSIFAYSTKMRATIEYVMNITLTKNSAPYEGEISAADTDKEDEPVVDDPSKDDPSEDDPTDKPSTDDPTDNPSTDDPSDNPSDDPSDNPSDDPTDNPSTDDPSDNPSDNPVIDNPPADDPVIDDPSTDEPVVDDPSDSGDVTDPTPTPVPDPQPGPNKPVTPDKPGTLKDGTYQLKADTDNRMFYLVPKEDPDAYRATLVKKGDKLTVTITLSGTGYDYLYMGTAKKANSADKSTWTKYKEENGYYSYTFDISSLDKELTIASHSESHDQWYEHTIIFYSKDAKLVKSGDTSTVPSKPNKKPSKNKNDKNNNTSGQQTEFKNDHKKDKESKSAGDTEKSTSVVDSSTGLKDGVYTPDKFSWSGGSGRLAYIRCDKITVTDGQAYATIVFSSPSYDQLKANGRVYYNGGSEFSTFVIPVKLNANNKIVGRTVAMSAPHWIEYSIFIYSNAAAKANGEKEITGDSIKTSKLSKKAPEIAGLEAKKTTKIKHAKNFKIFNYDDGVTLIQIDINNGSALKYKTEDKNADEKVEYDDEGKPIAKSQGEITNEMYHANVINYLIVPKDVEIPAGLDKECIIIQAPLKKSQISSEEAMAFMEQLGVTKLIKATGIEEKDIKIKSIQDQFKAKKDADKIFYAGTFDKPDYKEIIKNKIDINILPATSIPEKVKTKDEKGKDLSKKEVKKQKEEAKKAKETLETVEKRYSTIGIPVIVDRSASEKDDIAKAEWIKVYGAIFGCQKEAKKIFDKYVEEHKDDNNEN